jgi:hypothetical protein
MYRILLTFFGSIENVNILQKHACVISKHSKILLKYFASFAFDANA